MLPIHCTIVGRRRVGAVLLTGTLTLAGACADSTAPARPPAGMFHVVITTSGANLDPDGYLLTVDDTIARPVRPNDTVVVTNVALDVHRLRLAGIATNCLADGGPTHSQLLTSARDTTVQLTVACFGSSISPDITGLQLLFVRRGQIYRTTVGGDAHVVTLGAGEDPTWSPDGRRIAFVRKGDVYVMDADGANARLIARGWAIPNPASGVGVDVWGAPYIAAGRQAPAWSPDGGRLALYSDGSIVIAPVDSAVGPIQLYGREQFSHSEISGSPAWSPDGKHVAFVSDSSMQTFDLFVGDVTGSGLSNIRRMTDASATTTMYLQPAWSPDGKQIAMVACAQAAEYWKNPCAASRIVLLNADGSQPRTLAYANGYARPAWAPDGQTVAFANTCGEQYDCPSAVLYISLDGIRKGVLMDDAHSPSWRK